MDDTLLRRINVEHLLSDIGKAKRFIPTSLIVTRFFFTSTNQDRRYQDLFLLKH